MPEDNNKKKGSKRENKLQKQEVPINVEGQEALRNQKQAKPNEEELKVKVKEEGKSSEGLLKGVVNFIKAIFSATVDMPQQEQYGNREKNSDQQKGEIQDKWLRQNSQKIEQGTKKNPEDLDQEEVKEAGKELQKEFEMSQDSNQSIGTKTPGQTPAEAQQEKSDGKQIG